MEAGKQIPSGPEHEPSAAAFAEQSKTPTVLLIESTNSLRKVIAASLKQLGVRVLEAPDAARARNLLQVQRKAPDVIVVELDLPEGANGKLIERYRKRDPDSPSDPPGHGRVLLTTTHRPEDDWRRKYMPDVVVYKPFDVRFLCRRVLGLLSQPAG